MSERPDPQPAWLCRPPSEDRESATHLTPSATIAQGLEAQGWAVELLAPPALVEARIVAWLRGMQSDCAASLFPDVKTLGKAYGIAADRIERGEHRT